ncbi:hypothetical protein RRG08_020593 [Elysia crispata]|uniref:Uncharacterized protein n=1 Tax=Elysia crispata TaxID=231223 RepID=A0AAE1A800_9GAST|nr:hypothetical protein RRG08_020593 [Elysia crispata]
MFLLPRNSGQTLSVVHLIRVLESNSPSAKCQSRESKHQPQTVAIARPSCQGVDIEVIYHNTLRGPSCQRST